MTLTTESSTDERLAVSELWYTRCPVPTASSIAISQGWLDDEFEPDGITVSSLRASGDRTVRESHFDHTKADSFRQGGNIPPIWSRSLGRDLRLIGLSWVPAYQGILSLPGSGIEGPADLAGKRLGVSRRLNDQIDFWRATAIRGFVTTLAQADLTFDDATLVDLPVSETYLGSEGESHSGSLFGARTGRRLQSAEVLALVRGEIDAIYVSGARGVDLQALLDAHVVFDIGSHPDRSVAISNSQPAALTVSGDLLERCPDLVARYLAATLRAAEWSKDHRDETHRIIASEVGFAEEWVEDSYPGGIHRQLVPSLDDELVAAIDSQQQFLLEWGFIDSPVDLDEWIAPEPLAEAHRLLEHG